MKSLRILLTNNTLSARAGSELYLRDVALALLKRGHQPIAYSPRLGAVADELRLATVPVIDNLDALTIPPDVIHGQHHLETMTALLRFPQAPALHYCHGWLPWEETPLRHPRIYRYVAVDQLCRERLVSEGGVQPDRVTELFNFADLERFQPRPPLPTRPQKALFFSNYISEGPQLQAVRAACEQVGITLDVIGVRAGAVSPQPEKELVKYDLVFTKARSAVEALAVGASVILCDPLHSAGLGQMITTDNLESFRPLNFGIRTITQSLTPEHVLREIRRYDAADAQRVSAFMRANAGLDATIERLLGLYHEVLDEHHNTKVCQPSSAQAEAAYLRWLDQRLHLVDNLAAKAESANAEWMQARAATQAIQQQANAQAQALSQEIAQLRQAYELAQLQTQAAVSAHEQIRSERDQLGCEVNQLKSEREQMQFEQDKIQDERNAMRHACDLATEKLEAWQQTWVGRLARFLGQR